MFANPDWTEDAVTREFWRIDPMTGDRVIVYAREGVAEYPWAIVIHRPDGSVLLAINSFDSADDAKIGYDFERKYLSWSESRQKFLEWDELKSGKGFGRDLLRFGFVAVQRLEDGKGWYASCPPGLLLHKAGQPVLADSDVTVRHMVDILEYDCDDYGLKFRKPA